MPYSYLNKDTEKNWVVSAISKIGPNIFATIVVGSIIWIGSNAMQTNITLAVMASDMTALKEQIKSANNDKYSNTQATLDKSFVLSEIGHIKDEMKRLDISITTNEARILDLERKLPK